MTSPSWTARRFGNSRVNRRQAMWLLAAASSWPLPASAQVPWPTRPVRILVPTSPGGAPDIAGRLIAQYLSDATGQPFVVENRAGANGNIAMIEAVKASPDGYTLLLGADSYITINPHIYSKLPINPLRDFIPVASVASNDFLLAVTPNVPVSTLPELIEYARNAKPLITFATAGYGSQHQLAMEMLKRRAGIDLLHVPFRGGTPATMATIAGEVQVLFAGGSSRPQVKAGLLRAVASTGHKRAQDFPDLPTIGELYPGYVVQIWLGLFAPVGTPEPIVATLRGLTNTILKRPDFAARLGVSGGLEPLVLSEAEFADLIQQDYEKYGKLISEIGVKLD
jgi:tripartite-type tricarboxylate transporter receptor subunit TctC